MQREERRHNLKRKYGNIHFFFTLTLTQINLHIQSQDTYIKFVVNTRESRVFYNSHDLWVITFS